MANNTKQTISNTKSNNTSDIIVKARELLGSALSGVLSQKFPNDLSSDRYMQIDVYNTDQVDMVNKGFEPMLNKAEEISKQAFTEVQTSLETDNALWNSFGTTAGANAKLPDKFKASFFLPFPNSLNEELSHVYDETDGWVKDALGAAAGVAVADAMGGGTTSKIAGGVLGNMAQVGVETGIKTLEGISAGIAKATGSQAYRFYENKIMMYNHTNFRSITLDWTFIPNNQTEANTLHKMVQDIKMYSSPQSLAGKLMVRSPHFFKLNFKNKTIQQALQFNECNLTNITISYSPSGNMELLHDKMPKSITMSIQFTEREPKLAEDWGAKPPSGQKTKSC